MIKFKVREDCIILIEIIIRGNGRTIRLTDMGSIIQLMEVNTRDNG